MGHGNVSDIPDSIIDAYELRKQRSHVIREDETVYVKEKAHYSVNDRVSSLAQIINGRNISRPLP
jgi:hypothetical protein